MNRTLVETARSMLVNANLPHRFWAEALSTATYLRNRSPTKAVCGMTPHEAWTGEKPRVDALRVFGCQAFVHIPKDERKELDSKSRKCILLGYGTTTKGYRLYDPLKKMSFSMSRSVVSRSPLRLRSRSHLCISNIQMNPRRQLSRPYLKYDDLNVRGDRPTSMVSDVTCLMSRSQVRLRCPDQSRMG